MDAVPGKRLLIERAFRPPNYETPVALGRYAYMPNDTLALPSHAISADATSFVLA